MRIIIILGMLVITFCFFIFHEKLFTEKDKCPSDVVYTCVMDPQVELPRPGKCPKCGMDLVPRKKKAHKEYLILTDQQIQQAGVRYAMVKRRSLVKFIETTGRVTYDPRRIRRIASYSGGRIERLYPAFTGALVKKGELLAEIYSPKILLALDEFSIALQTYKMLKSSQHPDLEILKQEKEIIASSKNLLRRLGLTEKQLIQVEQNLLKGKEPYSRDKIPTIKVYSPLEGFVIRKLKDEGAYVLEGEDIFHIAELTKVWIYIDIYEYELPFVKLAQEVKITARALSGKEFTGRITYIDPFLQPKTRTIRVRCEVDNKDLLLKPNMFAKARIACELGKVLSLPADAVLLSGLRSVVILSSGSGKFKPVEVRLGRKWLYPIINKSSERRLGYFEPYERYHEVISGLNEGDVVVTSGAFLLNSEANFQRILVKMLPEKEITHEPPPQVQKLRPLLEEVLKPYFKIADTLASDDITHVAHLMGKIRKIAGRTDEFEKISKIAEKSFEDIEDAREIFSELSREVVGLVRRVMPDKVKEKRIYIIECPMAEVDFKLWLQETPEIKNPWYGSEMLHCGRILER